MAEDLEQVGLWDGDRQHLREVLDAARDRWAVARRRSPIGSEDEETAWAAYRLASDRYWEFLGHRGVETGASRPPDRLLRA